MPMQNKYSCGNLQVTADTLSPIEGGFILRGSRVVIENFPSPTRYLYSGWQSWSLTSWVEIDRKIPPLRPAIMHPREVDPFYSRVMHPNGSWYGALELSKWKILFLGSLDFNAHVCYEKPNLIGLYEEGVNEWLLSEGNESDVFRTYSEILRKKFIKKQAQEVQRVWCSWYSLYAEIREEILLKILEDFGHLGHMNSYPLDVFQIDDGWQRNVGNWEANKKFPSGMKYLADKIKDTGRKAGLWLAPLILTPSSQVFKEHPEWVLRNNKGKYVSAGFNWGEHNFALDTTHPAALEWLKELMRKVKSWGYEYVKLDFLYAGALPGKRFKDIPRENAYRMGLEVIREGLGDAYFLACGAPILPTLGLCDGLRVGQDVADYWSSHLFDDLLANFGAPGVRNAICNVLHRFWLKRLVQIDPDVVYFNSIYNTLLPEQKMLLQGLSEICQFKATSDIPQWLTEGEKKDLLRFLTTNADVEQVGPLQFQQGSQIINFEPYINLPPPQHFSSKIMGGILGGLANLPIVINTVEKMDQMTKRKRLKGIIE
jgi:alpha-galactosidase